MKAKAEYDKEAEIHLTITFNKKQFGKKLNICKGVEHGNK